MLQSPHFLFRVERGADGPDAQFEIASRLSYFLWDTMPSDDLLRAAGKGELATAEQIEATARRMLEDPRARSAMEEFLAQWMRFDRVLEATRDRRRFREFNAEVAAAMVEETRRLFDHLVWDDRNFMEFFTADYTFVNRGPRPALRPAGPRRGIREGRVPGGFRPFRRAGARQLPGADQQARGNVPDRAGVVRPEPFPRPGNPAASGRE